MEQHRRALLMNFALPASKAHQQGTTVLLHAQWCGQDLVRGVARIEAPRLRCRLGEEWEGIYTPRPIMGQRYHHTLPSGVPAENDFSAF